MMTWLTLASLAGGARSFAATPPNVVLIMTDDQGYGDLGCHGNAVLKTPNLDRLYVESTRFTNFHVESLCAPTRAALMTGRYPFRVGVRAPVGGWSTLRSGETTIADVFAAGGYRTALFGKWHLGDNYPCRPHERGFHEGLTFGAGAISTTADSWGNDCFDDVYWRNGRPERFSGYCTDVFFREGLRFIAANRERPFFVCLTPNAPHTPLAVEEKYRQPYLDGGLPRRLASFYAMIANIDENIGRLRARLEELGLEQNTMLIFMTDNGTADGYQPGAGGEAEGFNAGMRGKKGGPYDGGHRVPLFIHWPAGRIAAGRDIPRLTAQIDILPTLIELTGLHPPRAPALDGVSLAPLLQNAGDFPADRTLFLQHTQQNEGGKSQIENLRPFVGSTVLTERWRLVNGTELFDAAADPSQTRNVAADHRDIVGQLRANYENWFADVRQGVREPVATPIGSPGQPLVQLTCYDWHTDNWVAWQDDVRKLKDANGYWALDVARPGRYRFTLRQQPVEAACPIQAKQARLRIAAEGLNKAIEEDAMAVSFDVELGAGRCDLQTWFTENRGAYYVDVESL
jgi:arylsulfatase A-like enzyme